MNLKKTNNKVKKIVIFMTDRRYHINTINDANNILSCEVIGCVTNKIDTYYYIKENYNIPLHFINWDKSNESRDDYEMKITKEIQYLKPNILLLTGWKHIFNNNFIKSYQHIINIHPALPNSYIGLNCIEKAHNDFINNKITHTGLMIHYITEELDRGEVLEYTKVPLYKEDNLNILTERFRIYEKNVIIKSLLKIINNNINDLPSQMH